MLQNYNLFLNMQTFSTQNVFLHTSALVLQRAEGKGMSFVLIIVGFHIRLEVDKMFYAAGDDCIGTIRQAIEVEI